MQKHFSPNLTDRIARATSLLPLVLFFAAASGLPQTAAGNSYRASLQWAPSLGVELSFMLDGLSVLFILIITGIGFFVTVYAVDYLHGHGHTRRFFIFLHGFMLSMLGLVTADNVLALFVFWELTTIFSYLLIGFEHEDEISRQSARQALLVTGSGGLALLAGFLLLGIAAGTYEISEMISLSGGLKIHPLYDAILVLILLGAFTKSAQFPFHFWLPNAMAAPAPISAFLHSATMVKGGIYLLARFHPVLGGSAAWTAVLVTVGAATAVISAFTALGQSDLKKILAYTTVAALGLMTMFLGGTGTPSLTAAVTFLMVHALYKSSLFLAAGIVDHQTGTRQIEDLAGLGRAMPFTAFAVFAACLSMAGFPLFFGFIGKEIMYKGALAETMMPGLTTAAAVLSNGLMTAVAAIFLIGPFLSRRQPEHEKPVEASFAMWCGPVILGGITIVFGILPDFVGEWLVSPAVWAFHHTVEDVHLSLYHGINKPLGLSVLTLAMGGALYMNRKRVNRTVCAVYSAVPVNGTKVYEAAVDAVASAGKAQNRLLQNGSFHRYFYVVVSAFVLVTAYGYLRGMEDLPPVSGVFLSARMWLLVTVILAAVLAVVTTNSVLLAICSLGVVGAGIAVVFLSFGAPDLALTQLLVETLTVIIVSVILLRLPGLRSGDKRTTARKWFDGALSAATGLVITVLMLTVVASPLDLSITEFFESNSYLAAHGKNIVNVILVDFRSMDTLGEIIVVAAAGLAGYGLIRKRGSKS